MKKGHVWRKLGFILIIAIVITLLTGCMMREETVKVQGISWMYRLTIEKYVLCEEDGWSLPDEATLVEKKREIYKSKYDDEGDFVGYEYRTKYYYTIWRWKFDRYVDNEGEGHEASFADVILVDDERISKETETHYITGLNQEDKEVKYTLDKEAWLDVGVGDVLTLEVSIFGNANVIANKKAIEKPYS